MSANGHDFSSELQALRDHLELHEGAVDERLAEVTAAQGRLMSLQEHVQQESKQFRKDIISELESLHLEQTSSVCSAVAAVIEGRFVRLDERLERLESAIGALSAQVQLVLRRV